MGLVYADITLLNFVDVILAKETKLDEDKIRKTTVNAMVDCGSYLLSITEPIKEKLGLHIVDERNAELADGSIQRVPVAGPIEIRFENRMAVANAFVIGNEVLLGVIPMEELDVVINPRKQTLEVNPENPDIPKMKLK